MRRRSIDELSPDPGNPRHISDEAARGLEHSLSRFGDIGGIVWNRRTGQLVTGHQRVARLRAAGVTAWEIDGVDLGWIVHPLRGDRFPVRVVDWSPAEQRAANISANNPTISGDFTALAPEQLGALKVDLPDFGDLRLDALLADIESECAPVAPDAAAEDAPPVQERAVSQTGDLWLLDSHRLLCGDATKREDVARVMGGARPFLCVTDPPYGVEYNPAWRSEAAAKGHLSYAGRRVGKVTNDNCADWSAAWALTPSDVIYSWHPAGATSLVHAAALQGSGFVLRMQIIWAKSNFPIGRGDYHVRHEPCWYAVRDGKAARRTDDRTQTTLWEINLDRNVEGGHSTQKPVECMARPIRNHDAPDVYDPFLGSGTTLIAAEQLGRRCYALEIEPRYVDVAVRRWQNLTGKDANLDGSGKTFAVVERRARRTWAAR